MNVPANPSTDARTPSVCQHKVPFFNQRSTRLSHASSCQNQRSYTVFLSHVGTEEVQSLVSRIIIFSELELDSMSSPPSPNTNVDTNINVKNRTRRCAINLRGFSFAQHPILKFQGQGDTHRVKMKSKASGQTTDAVVAEWQTACETHGHAILSQTLRSVLTLPAT